MSQPTSPETIVAQHFASRATCVAGRHVREAQGRKFVEAAARGLSILEAFGQRGGTLGNADLHELTGLSKPTVTRLTHTLLALGYLRRTKTNRFQLSPAMMTLVRPLCDALVAKLPLAALNTLASAGPWCIVVAEPSDDTLVVTASFSGYQPGTPVCPIGTRLDLSLTSAGHVLLATQQLDVSQIHSNDFAVPSIQVIGAARAQLVAKGFCFEASSWRRGVATAAVPVPNQLFAQRIVMGVVSDEPATRERLMKELVPAIKSLFA